jgi:GWxTD domain-containing protein
LSPSVYSSERITQSGHAQFWLRRDRTPGTPRNEFKEEHYRRIAYANARFREATEQATEIPSWKTDRGRIYIRFGPPDEIESYPHGGPSMGMTPSFPLKRGSTS